MTYLAACMTFRDEAPYLREWIEFHRIVGVERFFLYDTGSTDDFEEVLAPYVDRGTVTVEDWPGEARQSEAIDHCLALHAADTRWIAFIDADEFLFSPGGRPVPEVLEDFEDFPGVGVNLIQYGTSGHVAKPAGFVIENYLHRSTSPIKWVKNIVQPARTTRCRGAHVFEFDSGHAVDVAKRPLDGWVSQTFNQSPLRINHYYTKSLEELRVKYAKTRADTGELRPPPDMALLDRLEAKFERDTQILRYVPELKERLED